jgi:hypothetical protein
MIFLCFYFSRTNTFCKFATKYTKGTTMVGTLRVSDVYMDILGTLPNEDKLDLISRLVQSMKKAVTVKKEQKDIFARFSNDWGGNMTTEEYADMLRSENVESTRTVETW